MPTDHYVTRGTLKTVINMGTPWHATAGKYSSTVRSMWHYLCPHRIARSRKVCSVFDIRTGKILSMNVSWLQIKVNELVALCFRKDNDYFDCCISLSYQRSFSHSRSKVMNDIRKVLENSVRIIVKCIRSRAGMWPITGYQQTFTKLCLLLTFCTFCTK